MGFDVWIQGPKEPSRDSVAPFEGHTHLLDGVNSTDEAAVPEATHSVANLLAGLPIRISDVIKPWAERLPDHPALTESFGTWTYRQLAEAVSDAQRWLAESGVRPGDRVLLVGENCRAFVVILLAVAALDAWPVLASARLSTRELDEIQEHSGARRTIYTTSVSAQAREHAKRHGAVAENVGSLGPVALGPINHSAVPERIDAEIPHRVAALIYTSGTTGVPKGVMLTHRNLLFVAATSAKIRSLTPDDRVYGILPMSHAVGLSVVLLGSLLSGSTLYLAPRFDPVAALGTLEREGMTVVLGAPGMFSLFADYAKLRNLQSLKLPALRIISSCAAPLQPTVKSRVEGLFEMMLHNGYGVTECSPNISQTAVGEYRGDTSVGQALPGVEVQLVGEDRQPVAEAEIGELWVRGPNVMKGYYRAPDETAAAINAEGWFNTRDLARMENGNLFIVGRTSELIVRFGENVYPVEVEAVLNAHPAVARSAVVGRSVEGTKGGEEIVAFVQLSPSAACSAGELAQHAAQHLSPHKRPSQILLVGSMPLTSTGKVIKAELAKMTGSVPAR